MMSFPRWSERYSNTLEKRLTYAVGSELWLRRQVLASAYRDDTDPVTVWAEDDDYRAQIFTNSLRHSKRKVVLVRNAHLIKDWSWLPMWHKKTKDILIIAEGLEVPGDPHVEKYARLVNCYEHTRPAAEKALENFLALKFGLSAGKVRLVLSFTRGRVDPAIDILTKLRAINAPVTAEYMQALSPRPDEFKFEEALRTLDKTKAMTLAPLMPIFQIPEIIERLEYWLAITARTMAALDSGQQPFEIASIISLPRKDTLHLCEEARRYNSKSLGRATVALAEADRAYQSGARVGVLEVLVTTW